MQNKVPEHSPPPNLLLSTVFGILVNGNSILPVYKLKPHTPHQNCWKSSQLFLQNKVRNQSYLTPPTSPLVQATDISLPDDCPNLLIPCFCTDHPVFLEKKTRQFYKTNCRMFKTLWSPPSQSKTKPCKELQGLMWSGPMLLPPSHQALYLHWFLWLHFFLCCDQHTRDTNPLRPLTRMSSQTRRTSARCPPVPIFPSRLYTDGRLSLSTTYIF